MSKPAKPIPSGAESIPVMITPFEYWKKKWGVKVLVYGSIILVLGGLGIWLGPRTVSGIAAWRARKLVDFAEVQKKAGNTVEMKSLLLQAFGLARNDERVLHAMAENYAGSPPEALQFLQLLAYRKDATREDRLRLCRTALDYNLLSFAKGEFERMMKDPASKNDPEIAELIARYLTLDGTPQKALAWTDPGKAEPQGKGAAAVEAVTTTTPSSSARLNLIRAKLLLNQDHLGETELKQLGADVVVLLSSVVARGDEQQQREASLFLARLYVTMPAAREAMGATAAENILGGLGKWFGEPQWEPRLLAADLQIFLKPDSKEAVIGKLTEDARQTGETARLALARWLNSRTDPQKAQAMAEAHEGNTKIRDWFLIRLDALAGQQKWKEIKDILMVQEGVPIELILGRLFLWRCAKETGESAADIEKARLQILEASKNSASGPDFFVAAYLERFGERETAASLYQKHIEDETVAGPAFVGLARCISADPSKTSVFRDVLEKMLARYPNVSEARNDLAYINLLEGKKLNESIQTATILVADSPQTFAYRTTMALAELARGNYKAAEAIYTDVKIDWAEVTPGWRAVRAAVMGANGNEVEAKKLAASIDSTKLREGESKLLDQYVLKRNGAGAHP